MATREFIFLLVSILFFKLEYILAQLTCAPTSGSIAEYEASDIKLSDVVYCSYAHRSKSLIVIRSFNTTYINSDYPAHQGVRIQPSLLIISPTVVVDGSRKINLHGSSEDFIPIAGKPSGRGTTKGVPGRAGGTAGSVILAYRDRRATNGGTLNFNMDGGAGGNGQAGQDGSNGSPGSRRYVYSNDESTCSAWNGGWTKVWLTPNWCSGSVRSDGRCSGNTVTWEVYGTSGTSGRRGNDGGLGGRAGKGGFSLQADVMSGRNTTAMGSDGRAGMNGAGGSGGSGGRKGDTNRLRISVAGNIFQNKRCQINSQQWISSSSYASNGASGTSGGNSNGVATPPNRLEASSFTSHIRTYVSRCNTRANQLGDSTLRSFCTKVQSHFRL